MVLAGHTKRWLLSSECSLFDVPRRRFRFKHMTVIIISAKASYQKLLGEGCIMFLPRKYAVYTFKVVDGEHPVIVRSVVF